MVEPRRKKRGNRRRQRLIWACLGTLLGTAVLAAGGIWWERRQNTDLADPQAGVTRKFDHEIPDHAPTLTFTDIGPTLGITGQHGAGPRGRLLPEDTGSGIVLADFDSDGDWDLFLPNFATDGSDDGANFYYRNDGDQWTESAVAAGLDDPHGFAMGATVADFDADGDPDLYVTQFGPNRLFRNRGDGTFEEVGAEFGVNDDSWSVGSAWGDFDRDGLLDLYVVNYLEFEPEGAAAFASEDPASEDPEWQAVPFTLNPNAFDPVPNRLYRQRSDRSFEELALSAGVSDRGGRGLGVTAVDLDRDGWLDLYVTNDVSPNALFRNLGLADGGLADGGLADGPIFEDWSARTGTADPRGSMGIAVADLDLPLPDSEGRQDGLPDLFISHWIAQENALYLAVAEPRLEYRDRVRDWRLGEISTDRVGWGCGFLDIDLDGRLDLAVANGSTLEEGDPKTLIAQAPFLLWNDGQRFYDLAPGAGPALAGSHVARGLAVGDLDRDGDPDLALSINRGRPLILRNDQDTGHHGLTLELAGDPARYHGARVEVSANGRRQIRWWGADASFASQHAPELIFGLGTDDGPVTVEIFWIGAEPSRHGPLEVDRRHRILSP